MDSAVDETDGRSNRIATSSKALAATKDYDDQRLAKADGR